MLPAALELISLSSTILIKEHTNLKATFSKKKSRINVMQMCGFLLVCNFLWLTNFQTCYKEGFSIVSGTLMFISVAAQWLKHCAGEPKDASAIPTAATAF